MSPNNDYQYIVRTSLPRTCYRCRFFRLVKAKKKNGKTFVHGGMCSLDQHVFRGSDWTKERCPRCPLKLKETQDANEVHVKLLNAYNDLKRQKRSDD